MSGTRRLTVRGRLLLVTLGVAGVAVLLAGFGVVRVAWWVVRSGDMMAAKQFPTFQRETLLYLALVTLVALGGAAAAAWALSGRLVRPLLRVKAATESIAAGDYAVRVHEPRGDELGDLGAAIDRMAASLAEVEALRRELVANVAHELRTPLTTARAMVDAMLDGTARPDEASLGSLADEIGRLIRLVQALQALTVADRAASGGLARERLDAGALVREIASGMAPLFEEKAQALSVDLPDEPLLVSGDRDALVQILVNLLDNACKYSPGGERIAIRGRGEDARVRIEVRNSGVEIAAADLPHVFERFYRGEKSRARELGGVGVGLAIASSLAEACGAQLQAESEAGSTCFRLTLPAAGRDAAVAGPGRRRA